MKITQTIALLSSLILAAGCAHEEHQAQYDESITPNANATGQNNNQYSTYRNDNGARNGSQSDDALAAQVRQSLQQDPQIAPVVSNIQINANNGTVVLRGSVQSGEQKRQIESIVAGASGVVVVDDDLRVSQTMNPTSRSNAGGSIYSNGTTSDENNQPASNTANGADNSVSNVAPSGMNNSTNDNSRSLNPTSNGTNSAPRIYHDSAGSMDASTNNAMSPTSRTNGESQIYQENQNQNAPGVNTNGNNKIP